MTKYIDPVCGMQFDDPQAAITEKLDGDTYYFCSIHCRESFLMAPGVYLRARSQDAKDRCPVCGMQIGRSHAAIAEKLDGETYYFCSIHCRESFLMVPGAYLRARNQDAKGGCCSH